MKQYRNQPGTDSRIYYLLTVKDDGTMLLYFHGTDRSLTKEATVNADGWIATNGALFPPLDHPNGRWQEVAYTEVMSSSAAAENTDHTPAELEVVEPAVVEPTPVETEVVAEEAAEPEHTPEAKQLELFAMMKAEIEALRVENQRLTTEQNMMHEERARACYNEQAPAPTPRRAKKKQVTDVYANLYGSPAITIDHTADRNRRYRMIFATVATAIVFVVMVNTVGLFGVAALGLLIGGAK